MKVILLYLISVFAFGKNILFVTKDYNLSFFKEIERGCLEAAKELGLNCIFLKMKEGNSRLQHIMLEKILKEKKIDGLAFAVINSRYSAKYISKLNIPTVTIDADFSEKDLKRFPFLRSSYIGTDNYELGYKLGLEYFKRFKSMKNEVCLISGHKYSHNLNLRIKGFKEALIKKFHKVQYAKRCPLYGNEKAKASLEHVNYMIKSTISNNKKISVISMGAWPQLDLSFTDRMLKYKKYFDSKQVAFASIDTLKSQLVDLDKGIAEVLVGQNPFQMGKDAFKVLADLIKGIKVKEKYNTPIQICDNRGCS